MALADNVKVFVSYLHTWYIMCYLCVNYSNVLLIIYFISVIEAKEKFIATVNPRIYDPSFEGTCLI